MKEFDEVHRSGVVDRVFRSSAAKKARVNVRGTIDRNTQERDADRRRAIGVV
jgi:hypothetical protein